jgi:hypothetical protein
LPDGLTERLGKQHAVIIAEIEAKQHVDEKYFDQLKISIEDRYYNSKYFLLAAFIGYLF